MTAKDLQTGLHKAVRHVAKLPEETPAERVATMVQKTVLGVLLVGVGIGGMLVLEMNHYLAAGFIVVGATVWSGQVITGALKALIEPLAGLRKAWKGGD